MKAESCKDGFVILSVLFENEQYFIIFNHSFLFVFQLLLQLIFIDQHKVHGMIIGKIVRITAIDGELPGFLIFYYWFIPASTIGAAHRLKWLTM